MTGIQQGVPQLNSPMVGSTGAVTQPWYLFFLNLWARTGGAQNDSGNTGTYTGEIRGFAGPTLPTGWLLCDGSVVGRTTYSDLFSIIGTNWGAGNGSTTFGIPNLQGKFPIGVDPSFVLGASGGASSVALTVPNLAAHNHAIVDPGHSHTFVGSPHTHTVSDPGHFHSAQTTANNATTGVMQGSQAGNTGSAITGITIGSTTATGTNATNTTGVSTANTGTGQSFSIVNPYAAINWMIKT